MEAADSPGIHTSADFFVLPISLPSHFVISTMIRYPYQLSSVCMEATQWGLTIWKRLEIAIQYIRRMSEGQKSGHESAGTGK